MLCVLQVHFYGLLIHILMDDGILSNTWSSSPVHECFSTTGEGKWGIDEEDQRLWLSDGEKSIILRWVQGYPIKAGRVGHGETFCGDHHFHQFTWRCTEGG